MARVPGKRVRDKGASHDRIVNAAAAAIRRDGADRLSVAALMQAAGLTHGGFYRHFDSREALVDAAVAMALADGVSPSAAAASGPSEDALRAVADAYLSPDHREHPETGCAVAALAADVTRASDAARDSYTARVRCNIESLSSAILRRKPEAANARGEAITALSAMVGAILIARATANADLSDEILQTVHDALLADR